MKISLVCFEDGLDNIGFRKIASYIKSIHKNTIAAYVPTGNLRSLFKTIIGKGTGDLSEENILLIADFLSKNDVIGICSMTQYSFIVKKVISKIRKLNPNAYVVWGGIHAIIHPEDAILFADAVCTGEGEFAFERMLHSYSNGENFTDTPGFWFNSSKGVIKNRNLPLMTQNEMDELPLLLYQNDEFIFRPNSGFEPIKRHDFVRYTGLSYNTVWSIGCPLMCTYCGNSKFIEYDKGYRRVRHSSVETIINELKVAISKHPHISTIVFHDDSFMALPTKTIEEFSKAYKEQIKIPFAVFGVIPNYVDSNKIDILADAGLNRLRMGIQSGSERILEFYERPTPMNRINDSVQILNKYKDYMIPPAFDIILENPIETQEDTLATTDLLYNMPRPFTLNIFALRIIPNTLMAKKLEKLGIEIPTIDQNYATGYQPTIGNIFVFLNCFFKLPIFIYSRLRKKIIPPHIDQNKYPISLHFVRILYLIHRAFSHLRYMDFSVIPGNAGYMLWKIKFIKLWTRYMVKNYTRKNTDMTVIKKYEST
jgi:anaerobic magnesium-protoporphyrin IX monomethyl ester cyclase